MTQQAKIAALRAALQGVIRVADRATDEFDAAREALALTADDAEQAPLIAGMKIVCDPSMEPGAMKFVYPNPAPVAATPAPNEKFTVSVPWGSFVFNEGTRGFVWRHNPNLAMSPEQQYIENKAAGFFDRYPAAAQVAPAAPIAAEPAPKPWQDRMAAHFGQGKSVQCHPASHFMQQEIDEWRKK